MSYDDHIYGEPPENFEREPKPFDCFSDDCATGDHGDCPQYLGLYECLCDCHEPAATKHDQTFGDQNVWR